MAKGNTSVSTEKNYPSELFQGAFIDAEGNEVPITEAMIQRACKALEPAAASVYAELPVNAYQHSASTRRRC